MFGYYKLISNSKSASIAIDYPPIVNIHKSQLKDIIPTGLLFSRKFISNSTLEYKYVY